MGAGHNLFVMKIFSGHGFGINFAVYPYRNVIGISSKAGKRHVIFGDYERRLNARKIRDAMDRNDIGLLFFFKSSEGRYHFISPQMFEWLDALRISKELGAEKNYLSISSVRGEFILRVSKKGIKGEPVLDRVFTNGHGRNKRFLLSGAHSNFLEKFYGIDRCYFNNSAMMPTRLTCEKYRTTNL
jgi:hypothetical protein